LAAGAWQPAHGDPTEEAPNILEDISNHTDLHRRPPGRPTANSRKRKILKTGNWADDQLQAAIHAHDGGMNMR
jgi:hypothetical protein